MLSFTSHTITLAGIYLEKLFYDLMQGLPRQLVCQDARYNPTDDKEKPIVNRMILLRLRLNKKAPKEGLIIYKKAFSRAERLFMVSVLTLLLGVSFKLFFIATSFLLFICFSIEALSSKSLIPFLTSTM